MTQQTPQERQIKRFRKGQSYPTTLGRNLHLYRSIYSDLLFLGEVEGSVSEMTLTVSVYDLKTSNSSNINLDEQNRIIIEEEPSIFDLFNGNVFSRINGRNFYYIMKSQLEKKI